jgi:hypothetical protein
VKGLVETFADLKKLLKIFENMDTNTGRFSLIQRNVHGALSAYNKSVMKKETNQANHHGHISEKSDNSSKRTSCRSFGTYSRRSHCYLRR